MKRKKIELERVLELKKSGLTLKEIAKISSNKDNGRSIVEMQKISLGEKD